MFRGDLKARLSFCQRCYLSYGVNDLSSVLSAQFKMCDFVSICHTPEQVKGRLELGEEHGEGKTKQNKKTQELT